MKVSKSSIRRILLVALDNLGDLVFASALTPPLHAEFPSATVDVWCKEYTAPVAHLIPHTSKVIAADPFWAVAPNRPKPSIGRFLRSVSAVRREHYDVAVLSEAPWRTAAAVAAARIPIRIGLARHRNRPFLTSVLDAQDAQKPVVSEQARLLGALGIHVQDPTYRLDPNRLGAVRDQIARGLPERFVGLHPFASARDRCVPLPEWLELATALRERGLAPLWVGTTRELDEIRGMITDPHHLYVDRVNDASLTTSAAALSLASLFVGHDSGPLHIAAAFGVPVVGVFAPGQPSRTFPQGPGPWRIIDRPTPTGITASTMLREIDALHLIFGT
jgi:ADP-heptose:LPS heptosyltransferase